MRTAAISSIERASLNPFDDDVARAHSSYHAPYGAELVRVLETADPEPFARVADAALRAFILDERFSCLGAKSAIRRMTYRMGVYPRLDDPAVSRGLARDLYAFALERNALGGEFTTYAAVFGEYGDCGEEAFERALWSQLQRLHELDVQYHAWDSRVSDDPDDPRFSFSFASHGFFVVGLHPAASRQTRRFRWPALIFNAHEQFERLRADGRFAKLQRTIRAREQRLHGSLNPTVADYGEASEARQYAGRAVERAWSCPFKPVR